MRAILHVDMDAFYASVEQRDRPELRGKPVIVGGHPRRGVVLAATYEVRPFGVRSAMPMARALMLAPEAIVVPPRFTAYAEASEQVFAIFERYTPLIEPLSLDEAFLDVTALADALRLPGGHRRATAPGDRLRGAPAGLGGHRLGASSWRRSPPTSPSPTASARSARRRPASSSPPLPVSRLWGVGPKPEARLQPARPHARSATSRPETRAGSAPASGDLGAHLGALARGDDDRPVVPDRSSKSIGAEDTFEEDVADPELLGRSCTPRRCGWRGGCAGRVCAPGWCS